MLRPKHVLGAWILATALATAVEAHATTYYVATTGNDSNPGTEEKPWRTVAYSVSQMVAGDTTYVRGGVYQEGSIRFGKSGTSAARIKLLNYQGENPTISCIDPKTQFLLFQNFNGSNKAMGWMTIEGFEIKNCFQGLKGYNLHDSVIRRNWIHDNAYNGILLVGGVRNVIDRNRINHNGWGDTGPDPHPHGIYAHGESYVVTNNVIYDNTGYGIQQNGWATSNYSPSKHPSPEFAGANNWIIANNTLAYSHDRGGLVLFGVLTNNTRVENNIFYENGVGASASFAQGINFSRCCGTGSAFRNNLFYASGSGGMGTIGSDAIEGVHYTQSGNIFNISNPAFVNAPATLPASPNFALSERSPAIDKGLSPEESQDIGMGTRLTATKVDFNNTTRPQGRTYDIGAYEYSVGGDAQAPTAPLGLQRAN